jgi:hypothetical protein
MAGYHIGSLDWSKFQRFVDEPSHAQLLAFSEFISDALDVHDQRLNEGDPLRDWPSNPEALCKLVKRRLTMSDWYGDLSDAGKDVWESALTGFCSDATSKGVGFRVESDGVYWDVITIAAQHHEIPVNQITGAILTQFGTRPYRYHPPAGRIPLLEDWHANHSMHTPDEVQMLLEELKDAGPAILSASEEQPRRDYQEELLPAVEKVARARRLLFITVDT